MIVCGYNANDGSDNDGCGGDVYGDDEDGDHGGDNDGGGDNDDSDNNDDDDSDNNDDDSDNGNVLDNFITFRYLKETTNTLWQTNSILSQIVCMMLNLSGQYEYILFHVAAQIVH
jgi:hypothetical protein